ncbi:unnamed protein product [Lampetra planeri]
MERAGGRGRSAVTELVATTVAATSRAGATGDEPQSRAGMVEQPPAVGVPALGTTRSGTATILREATRPTATIWGPAHEAAEAVSARAARLACSAAANFNTSRQDAKIRGDIVEPLASTALSTATAQPR